MPLLKKVQINELYDLVFAKSGIDFRQLSDHYKKLVVQKLQNLYDKVNPNDAGRIGFREPDMYTTTKKFLTEQVGKNLTEETLRSNLASIFEKKGKQQQQFVQMRTVNFDNPEPYWPHRLANPPTEEEIIEDIPPEKNDTGKGKGPRPTPRGNPNYATNFEFITNPDGSMKKIQPRKPKRAEITEEDEDYSELIASRRLENNRENNRKNPPKFIPRTVEQMTAIADEEFTNTVNPDNDAPDNSEISQAMRDEFQANQDAPAVDIPVITPSGNVSTSDAPTAVAPSAPQQPPAGEPQFINPSYVKPQPLGTFYISSKGPVFATTELQQIAASNETMLEIDFNTPAGKKYIADKLKQVDELSKYIDEIRKSDTAGVNGANPIQIARDIVKKNAGLPITPVQTRPQFIRGQSYNPSNVPYSIF